MGEKDQLEAGSEASTDVQPTEQPAGASESATEGNEGSQEQLETTESQEDGKNKLPPHVQEAVNKAIGRQHKLFQEQREKAAGLEAELQKLRSQQPQEQRPVVPPVPDPLDDDFDQKMEVRDKAIKAQQSYDFEQKQKEEQARQQAHSQQEQQQRAFVEKAVAYKKRADALQIDPQSLQMAGALVSASGLPDALSEHILSHEQGPLITQHLAANLNDLETLRTMDPVSAGIHLATAIVPKLPEVKTKTGAPPPATPPGGQAAPPRQRGPEGCTYE